MFCSGDSAASTAHAQDRRERLALQRDAAPQQAHARQRRTQVQQQARSAGDQIGQHLSERDADHAPARKRPEAQAERGADRHLQRPWRRGSRSDGVRMSPLPRTTEINALHSQIAGAPTNSTWPSSSSAFGSTASTRARAGMVQRRAEQQEQHARKRQPAPRQITVACQRQRVRAVHRRRHRSARLIADEMAPPIAPPDNVCISIANGNTTAIAASASRPSAPT